MIGIFVRIAAVLALLAALFYGEQYIERRGYERCAAMPMAAIQAVQLEAAGQLATQTIKTRSAELALQDLKNTQELQDALHQKTVADLSDRLRRLTDSHAGRLRDPYAERAAGCGAGGGGTTASAAPAAGAGAADPAQAYGLLSAELVGLLQRLTHEADDINLAYASCRADAYAVRAQQ